MFTVEVRAGRLIEARIEALRNLERAAAYSGAFGQILQRGPAKERMILCADHRAVAVYPQQVTNELASLFGAMNQRLQRIALLVAPSNATLTMQLSRIVREAQNPERRVFFVMEEAETFLGEVLTVVERSRLAQFLRSEPTPVPSSRYRSPSTRPRY
jgi:hypothetical protein